MILFWSGCAFKPQKATCLGFGSKFKIHDSCIGNDQVPFTLMRMAELLKEAGLPSGAAEWLIWTLFWGPADLGHEGCTGSVIDMIELIWYDTC